MTPFCRPHRPASTAGTNVVELESREVVGNLDVTQPRMAEPAGS